MREKREVVREDCGALLGGGDPVEAQAISDLMHGEYVRRLRRIGFELSPQLGDVRVDCSCRDGFVITPYLLEQVVSRHD